MKTSPLHPFNAKGSKRLKLYAAMTALAGVVLLGFILVIWPVFAPHPVVNSSVQVVFPMQTPSGAASIPSAPSSALARPIPPIPAPAVVMPPAPPHRELGDAPRLPSQSN